MATTTAGDGTELYFEESGTPGSDKPSVMLVHGITESGESWKPIVERLAETDHVVTMDLRGHGRSGTANRYDLEAMAGDVPAVAAVTCEVPPHIVGHSLGGAVVSAVGAIADVASVVNVDQSLRLASFKEGLMPVEEMLRDPATFPAVIDGLFAQLSGTMLAAEEAARIRMLRRGDQDVVLAVWELLFTTSPDEIDAVIAEMLAGYAGRSVPYLSLFGADPGDDYGDWLREWIPGAQVELWADHGHYPHLVDPDRFVARLHEFWAS